MAAETLALLDGLLEAGLADLECVQALTVLSVVAWGTSLDIKRAKSLSDRALSVAVNLNLHQTDGMTTNTESQETFLRFDTARRTWWTTYANSLHLALITGSRPFSTDALDQSGVKVRFPDHALGDGSSWSKYVSGMERCIQVAHDTKIFAYTAQKQNSDHRMRNAVPASAFWSEKLRELKHIEDLCLIPDDGLDGDPVVDNQQTSIRLTLGAVTVHVYRYQTNPELSLFSRKICDLPSIIKGGKPLAAAGTEGMLTSEEIQLSMGRYSPDKSHEMTTDSYQEQSISPKPINPSHTSGKNVAALFVAPSEEDTDPSWGIDRSGQVAQPTLVENADVAFTDDYGDMRDPVTRCASMAYQIVRLGVVHKSADIALRHEK